MRSKALCCSNLGTRIPMYNPQPPQFGHNFSGGCGLRCDRVVDFLCPSSTTVFEKEKHICCSCTVNQRYDIAGYGCCLRIDTVARRDHHDARGRCTHLCRPSGSFSGLFRAHCWLLLLLLLWLPHPVSVKALATALHTCVLRVHTPHLISPIKR